MWYEEIKLSELVEIIETKAASPVQREELGPLSLTERQCIMRDLYSDYKELFLHNH